MRYNSLHGIERDEAKYFLDGAVAQWLGIQGFLVKAIREACFGDGLL
jgi:hypothetical protein